MTSLATMNQTGESAAPLGVKTEVVAPMPLMVWSNKFSTGIGVLDKEHQALFEALNGVQAAVIAKEERGTIGALLHMVAEGTSAHFTSEETMMAASKYSGLALHILKHQHLLEQLNAFMARFHRGYNLDDHSLVFLRDWFIVHIQNDDLNFGLWLNEHGKK